MYGCIVMYGLLCVKVVRIFFHNVRVPTMVMRVHDSGLFVRNTGALP